MSYGAHATVVGQCHVPLGGPPPRPPPPRLPTCALVCCVRTISSSGMMCAGEKKCAPTSRSAAWRPPAILAPTSSMSMVEVLVDRMASGRQCFSRSGGAQ